MALAPASTAVLGVRLRDVADLGLHEMAAASPALRNASPRLRNALLHWRVEISAELQDFETRNAMAARLSRGFVAFLSREYQFLHVGRRREEWLLGTYSTFLDDLCEHILRGSDNIAPALADHHDRLFGFVRRVLEQAGGWERVIDGSEMPTCAEYSPSLQLEVLGLDPRKLVGPVLDLGCGEHGRLVSLLRGMGREDVFGIDHVAGDDDGLFRGNWFEAPLARRAWGTIVAHQSLSLHFLHAHLRSGEQAEAFASLYMRILGSLKPGGSFAYAPGLAFIEALLPEEWLVSRRRLATIQSHHSASAPTAVVVRRMP